MKILKKWYHKILGIRPQSIHCGVYVNSSIMEEKGIEGALKAVKEAYVDLLEILKEHQKKFPYAKYSAPMFSGTFEIRVNDEI